MTTQHTRAYPFIEEDIPFQVASTTHHVLVRTPERLAASPTLLLFFATDRRMTLSEDPYARIPSTFLAAGHRVASMDLPQHGELADAFGDGLAGMAAAVAAGRDVFAQLDEAGHSVIDLFAERGYLQQGTLVAGGISRGGYAALRLTARETRVRAVAALSPVTYLPALTEFAPLAEHPLVQRANLDRFIALLVGRPLFIGISSDDPRVGTGYCRVFCQAVHDMMPEADQVLAIAEDNTHRTPELFFGQGAEFLLRYVGERS